MSFRIIKVSETPDYRDSTLSNFLKKFAIYDDKEFNSRLQNSPDNRLLSDNKTSDYSKMVASCRDAIKKIMPAVLKCQSILKSKLSLLSSPINSDQNDIDVDQIRTSIQGQDGVTFTEEESQAFFLMVHGVGTSGVLGLQDIAYRVSQVAKQYAEEKMRKGEINLVNREKGNVSIDFERLIGVESESLSMITNIVDQEIIPNRRITLGRFEDLNVFVDNLASDSAAQGQDFVENPDSIQDPNNPDDVIDNPSGSKVYNENTGSNWKVLLEGTPEQQNEYLKKFGLTRELFLRSIPSTDPRDPQSAVVKFFRDVHSALLNKSDLFKMFFYMEDPKMNPLQKEDARTYGSNMKDLFIAVMRGMEQTNQDNIAQIEKSNIGSYPQIQQIVNTFDSDEIIDQLGLGGKIQSVIANKIRKEAQTIKLEGFKNTQRILSLVNDISKLISSDPEKYASYAKQIKGLEQSLKGDPWWVVARTVFYLIKNMEYMKDQIESAFQHNAYKDLSPFEQLGESNLDILSTITPIQTFLASKGNTVTPKEKEHAINSIKRYVIPYVQRLKSEEIRTIIEQNTIAESEKNVIQQYDALVKKLPEDFDPNNPLSYLQEVSKYLNELENIFPRNTKLKKDFGLDPGFYTDSNLVYKAIHEFKMAQMYANDLFGYEPPKSTYKPVENAPEEDYSGADIQFQTETELETDETYNKSELLTKIAQHSEAFFELVRKSLTSTRSNEKTRSIIGSIQIYSRVLNKYMTDMSSIIIDGYDRAVASASDEEDEFVDKEELENKKEKDNLKKKQKSVLVSAEIGKESTNGVVFIETWKVYDKSNTVINTIKNERFWPFGTTKKSKSELRQTDSQLMEENGKSVFLKTYANPYVGLTGRNISGNGVQIPNGQETIQRTIQPVESKKKKAGYNLRNLYATKRIS